MPPRRRPWPALQIDVGEGGGFAGVAERKEEARHVADAGESNRASASTTKSIRASYAEAARRSTNSNSNSNSVSASAMLSFCDDGRLKPSAFGAAIRAGREGAAMRPSEFSVSAVATTTEAVEEGGGRGGGGGGGAAGAHAAPQQQQEKPSTSGRSREANDGARREGGAWHQVRVLLEGRRRRRGCRSLLKKT